MRPWVLRTLRGVIAAAVFGSVALQGVVVASLWWGTDEPPTWIPLSFVTIVVLAIVTLQVIGACVWRLLTMVGRGTVFSLGAFRYVDLIIAALASLAILTFALAVVARFANHAVPEDEVAPGLVALVCGLTLVIAGVALLVYVLRTLLAQAVALDTEATTLRSELEEVI